MTKLNDRQVTLANSLDVLIGRIRHKIETELKNPKLILTVRNVGYKLGASVNKVDNV